MVETSKIFDLLTNSDEFFNAFLKRNPSIESHLVGFKLNPNCTCKSDIQKYLDENVSVRKFVDEWSGDNAGANVSSIFNLSSSDVKRLKSDKIRMVLKPTLPQSEWKNFKDVIGEVIEIEPNPDKYKHLMAIAREKWFYNGLTVLETIKNNPEDNTESIVWLVFFY
jgi:hypothetical protein